MRIGLQIEFFVGADEKDVEILPGPTCTDFGTVSGFSLSVRVGFHVDGWRGAPKRRVGIGIEARIRIRPPALNPTLSSQGADAPRDQQTQHSNQTTHGRSFDIGIASRSTVPPDI